MQLQWTFIILIFELVNCKWIMQLRISFVQMFLDFVLLNIWAITLKLRQPIHLDPSALMLILYRIIFANKYK